MESTGMGGKVALVTGGTSGIGKATAAALAAMGADVVIVGRDRGRGEKAAAGIRAQTGGRVDLALADLASQAGVRGLADGFRRRYDRLDVLVNNAGLVQSVRTESPDGIETTLATNHLAPFLLTNLLLDMLEESAPSRVVTVSSEAERWGNIDFDDLQSTKKYSGFPVYGMTKLANIMFTYELAQRLEGTGVTATCVHPGTVTTRFATNNRGPIALLFRAFKPFMRAPDQGADTVIWLASSPEVEGISGRYYADRKPVEPKKIANDPDARRRLWQESERLTGQEATA